MPTYPGGKAMAGTYQTIINDLPPHRLYVECFAGAGAILRYKRPAPASIAIDIDAAACAALEAVAPPGATVIHDDATRWLQDHPHLTRDRDTLIYCDPPYLRHVRSTRARIYRHEFDTPEEHAHLLDILSSLPAMVAISGYWSELYAERLSTWRSIHFPAVTRGGSMAEEWLWMNYPEPQELHDYRYLGDDYRERERIKRKVSRWRTRLAAMPRKERYAMLAALESLRPPSPD